MPQFHANSLKVDLLPAEDTKGKIQNGTSSTAQAIFNLSNTSEPYLISAQAAAVCNL
jgi:hypothetical protein